MSADEAIRGLRPREGWSCRSLCTGRAKEHRCSGQVTEGRGQGEGVDKREGDCPRQVACDEGRNQEVDGIEPDTGNANSLSVLWVLIWNLVEEWHSCGFRGFSCILVH